MTTEYNDTLITQLEFSVRAENCLLNAGIRTVGNLVTKSESDLMKIANFGRRSLGEVREILGSLGLTLSTDGSGRSTEGSHIENQMISAIARAQAARVRYEDAQADIKRLAALLVSAPLEDI